MNKTATHKTFGAAALMLAASPGPSLAIDARMAKALLKIDPDTRLEQVCDIEAMHRIGRYRRFKPDRAKSDVIAHPAHAGDTIKAPGAAFRSKGEWYSLSFECKATPDHLKVMSFTFQVGTPIPAARWNDLGLWR